MFRKFLTSDIEEDILARNNAYADRNRQALADRGIFALNLVSSPGSGKTTLLVRTIELEMLPACRAYGVGMIPWSPLSGGLLGGVLGTDASSRRHSPAALKRIDAYEKEQKTLNAVVNSPGVARNLESDVKDLKKRVDETFQGPPAAVMEKQKSSSKSMQYEGYSNRRTRAVFLY